MAGTQQQELKEEVGYLKRIVELLTVLAKAQLSDVVKSQLKDKRHRQLYELTGQLSIRELSRRTGFSIGKISGIWQQWEQVGLLIKDGSQYKKAL